MVEVEEVDHQHGQVMEVVVVVVEVVVVVVVEVQHLKVQPWSVVHALCEDVHC